MQLHYSVGPTKLAHARHKSHTFTQLFVHIDTSKKEKDEKKNRTIIVKVHRNLITMHETMAPNNIANEIV